MSDNILVIPDQNEIEIQSNVERLELYSDNYPFNLSLRISEFPDDKSFIKFIKSCERCIRFSPEYKEWRKYIFDVLGITTCSLTNEVSGEVSIEIHHHIPSLFVVVKSVINKKISNEESFSTFDICLDVIYLHYQNKIGYIPLVTTMHEKLHNGYLNIPIELIKGNYKSYLEEYSDFIDEPDLELIHQRMAYKMQHFNSNWSKDNYSINTGN